MEENDYYYIRCEICNSHINIDDFVIHTRICHNNENIRYIRSLIYDNNQIPTGLNMTSFIREHFHMLSDSSFSHGSTRPLSNIAFVPLVHRTGSLLIKDINKIMCDVNTKGKHECPICLEEVEGTNAKLLINCKHIFCLFCIQKWFTIKAFCPMCKKVYC